VLLVFYHTTKEKFYQALFEKSCAPEFLESWVSKNNFHDTYNSEDAIFENAGIKIIPPYLRESKEILTKKIPVVIQDNDITAIIHSHSKWSDGINTIDEMAVAAKEKGLQYLVLSDHSKSAFYAQGLTEDRLIAQHKEVDELNEKLGPIQNIQKH
jgi:DNA polymerase (family 10)